MSTNLHLQSAIGPAVQRAASRVLARLVIGISVILVHAFGLMYVQAVEADQFLDNAPGAAQALQCQSARVRGGESA
jgi:hypothetical protein